MRAKLPVFVLPLSLDWPSMRESFAAAQSAVGGCLQSGPKAKVPVSPPSSQDQAQRISKSFTGSSSQLSPSS